MEHTEKRRNPHLFTDKGGKKTMRDISGKCWRLGREIAKSWIDGAAIKASKYKG